MRKQEIRLRQGLSTEELQEIRRLADICEQHDGIHLKLNWAMLKNRSWTETAWSRNCSGEPVAC